MKFFTTNTKPFKLTILTKPLFVTACLFLLIINKESSAYLIGNLLGCSSFNCRLSAVEADVSQLKMQMVRLTGDPSMLQNSNGMNNFRPNQFNQGQNQMNQNQNGQNQQGQMVPNQQLTQATNNPANRVNLANLITDGYQQSLPQQQQLRRVQSDNQYLNGLNNQLP